MHAENYYNCSGDCCCVGAAKDDPQPTPPDEKANVHGIANVSVKTDTDQFFRGSDWSWCAVAGPAKIPDTTKSDGEAKDGRHYGEPSQPFCPLPVHAETKPRWKQPEPECKECEANHQGSDGGEPLIALTRYGRIRGSIRNHKFHSGLFGNAV